jgi:hypothetical protein
VALPVNNLKILHWKVSTEAAELEQLIAAELSHQEIPTRRQIAELAHPSIALAEISLVHLVVGQVEMVVMVLVLPLQIQLLIMEEAALAVAATTQLLAQMDLLVL